MRELLIAGYDISERVHVGNRVEPFAIRFHQVQDDGLDIFPSDRFEKLQARRVEQVVAWHGLGNDTEDWLEEML